MVSLAMDEHWTLPLKMFVQGKRKGLPAPSTEEEMNNWKSSQYNTVYAWQDPKKGFIWSKYLGNMFIWSKYLVHSSSSHSPFKRIDQLYWPVKIIFLCRILRSPSSPGSTVPWRTLSWSPCFQENYHF